MSSNSLPIVLSLATEEDIAALAEVQHSAFAPTLIHKRVFRNCSKEDSAANSLAHLSGCFGEGSGSRRLVTATQGDATLGFALWTAPVDEEEAAGVLPIVAAQARPPHTNKFPLGADVELGMSIFGQQPSGTRASPHWYLWQLAIRPEFQRRGAGTALLHWGCEQADSAGLSTYLKSSEEGLSVFKRAGFVPFGEPHTAGENDELVIHPLVRPPVLVVSRPTNGTDVSSSKV
ncbi:hypothetical protein RQP46_000459 [Phenoliferia psychrophenolica]